MHVLYNQFKEKKFTYQSQSEDFNYAIFKFKTKLIYQ